MHEVENVATELDQVQQEESTPSISVNTANENDEVSLEGGDFVPKKRFTQVYWKQKQAEREAEALRQELETYKAQQAPKQAENQAISQDTRPTLENFDYDESAYQEALIEYKLDQRLKAQEQQRLAQERQRQAQSQAQSFNDKAAQYAASNPAYDEAIQAYGNVRFNDAISQAVLLSDNGPQLHHYLLTNPQEASRISGMPPVKAAMELGRLESALLTRQKTVQPSKAPEPVQVNTGAAGGVVNNLDADKLAMDEFYAKLMEKRRGS